MDKSHYKKLKRILLLKGTKAKDYRSNRDLYVFLVKEGYLKKAVVRGFYGYKVTEKGKSAMYDYKCEKFRFRLTTFLTILGILISIVALLTQFE